MEIIGSTTKANLAVTKLHRFCQVEGPYELRFKEWVKEEAHFKKNARTN